jgi:hypothetical protein
MIYPLDPIHQEKFELVTGELTKKWVAALRNGDSRAENEVFEKVGIGRTEEVDLKLI